jgi:hypothetical protein
MKRIIPIIVIIFVLFAIGIFVSWWLTFSIVLTILGTLGYLERIFKIKLSRKWIVSLLAIFLLFSGAYNVTNFIKSKHSESQIEDLTKKEGNAKSQIVDLALNDQSNATIHGYNECFHPRIRNEKLRPL